MAKTKKVTLDKGSVHAAETGPAPWLSWLRARFDTERQATLAVMVIGILLFIPRLGSVGLWDPWETHYAEVARSMIVRDDYVYPYWESAYFFSKPALPMWMMALGMLIFGAESGGPLDPLGSWVEWGVRLPFAFVAIFALWAVYRIGTQLKDRATGLLACVVLASSAQFIFIGKQAMVDMPLVGFMTAALAFFAAAVFDQQDDRPANSLEKAWAGAAVALTLFPQLIVIGREVSGAAVGAVAACALLGVALIAAIALKASRRDTFLVGFYVSMALASLAKGFAPLAVVGPVVVFYVLFSGDWRIFSRSKILLGGAVYLLVGYPWYVTMTLFGGRDDEGKTFFDRFWLHDNFGRVGAGVHGDRGGVGYFLEQLSYAMFPWSAILPHALVHAGGGGGNESNTDPQTLWQKLVGDRVGTGGAIYLVIRVLIGLAVVGGLLAAVGFGLYNQFPKAEQLSVAGFVTIFILVAVLGLAWPILMRLPQAIPLLGELRAFSELAPEAADAGRAQRRLLLFVLIWAIWSYVFFTMSQTKFHHYIFPAVPALAILAGYWVSYLAEDPSERLKGWMIVVIFGLFIAIARDIVNDPQVLVNLFTYKYDRDYPRDINPRPFLLVLTLASGFAMVATYLAKEKALVMLSYGGLAVIFGAWISHHHFNMLSAHWSQYHLFKTYYDERKGDEPLYAYQLNWRGETFYSRNRVLQVKEGGANERMRALVDRPGREFIVTEQSRFHTLKGVLSKDKQDKLQILDQSNNKFYLCVVED